jgi:hypothetical protein
LLSSPIQIAAEPLSLSGRVGQSHADGFQQLSGIERLIKKAGGALVEGALPRLIVVVGGYKDYRQVWALDPNATLQIRFR